MVRQKTDLRVHEEITVLQKKISEMDIQLTEEKKTQVRMSNEANKKIEELNQVERAIKEEQQEFSEKIKSITDETNAIELMNRGRIKELKQKKIDLEHYISAMDIIEDENSYLRREVIRVAKEYDKLLVDQEEEREEVKQRNFDSRMTMEAVLRKEIQTLDTNFKVLAIQAMNNEAMTASAENKGLYTELSRREDLSRTMIAEQQASYEDLQRITIEHEVMITAADYYENVITSTAKAVKKQEGKERNITDSYDKVQEALETYESVCGEKFYQAKRILDMYDKYEILKEKNSRTRQESIRRCQKALQQSISIATELSTKDSMSLAQKSEHEESIDFIEFESSANIKHDALNGIENKLSEDESNYEEMWKSSLVKFPQLTGTLRTAVLRSDKYKDSANFKPRKKLLLPREVSASMTYHF